MTPHIGYAKDPVLKPWASKQMQDSNDEVLTGKRGLPFSAQSSCYPGGVPEQLLTPAQPFYFIQTPNEVWMIWESDHMVRRIYMTDKHSETVRPSWFGESIGHYEGGDTLVVDTIGLQTHNSFLDWFRTPHTEKEHVVERFKLSAPTARRWKSWSTHRREHQWRGRPAARLLYVPFKLTTARAAARSACRPILTCSKARLRKSATCE
jgi:hypothetical protein